MLFEGTDFNSYDSAESKAHEAFELYEDGKMPQALEELDRALEINPANSAWHFDKALTLDAMNRFDNAIKEYEVALQLNPHDLEILNSLAIDYTRVGYYDRAIETFEYIQELDPQFEPCYCNRIITYTEMGLHDLAEQMFYLAQQINPYCPLCYYNIGNSLFARGEYRKAIRCWQRTAEIEPSHPQINYRIAQAYWLAGQHDHAREHFLAELRVSPGDVDVILDFALFLLELGDTESAKEKFNRILELTPDFPTALRHLGEIAFDCGDYEEAVELFNQAIQQDGKLRGPRYRLAQYALIQGQEIKLKAYLIAELKLNPEDAGTLVSMGSMFLTIGETDLATHCLLRALDIDCTNPDAHYYLGLISIEKGRFSDAAEFFRHTLDLNSGHVGALRDSAYVYLMMGRLPIAAERITKASSLSSDDPQIRSLQRSIRIAQAIEHIMALLSRFCPRSFLRRLRR
jgi:tetratricopeptide (TPR) repeat protein